MGHVRATYMYDNAHESLEGTSGYKNILQLSIDVFNVNWKFPNKFEKMTEMNFRTNQVYAGSCSFYQMHNNGFNEKKCSLNGRFLFFQNLYISIMLQSTTGLHSCILSLSLMLQAFTHFLFRFCALALLTVLWKSKQLMFLQWYAMCKIVFH